MQVCFLDTSVLTNIVDVPHKNQPRAEVIAELKRRKNEGWALILPLTSLIETGNHIAQIDGGEIRRNCGERFVGMLELVIQGRAPFVLLEMGWDGDFLRRLVDGGTTAMPLMSHLARATLGCGDLSILIERDRYRARVAGGSVVEVWTFDGGLGTYA